MPEDPAAFIGFAAFIERGAREHPDKVYLHSIDQDSKLTYAGLERATAGVARAVVF